MGDETTYLYGCLLGSETTVTIIWLSMIADAALAVFGGCRHEMLEKNAGFSGGILVKDADASSDDIDASWSPFLCGAMLSAFLPAMAVGAAI